jgi:hypothetical protein
MVLQVCKTARNAGPSFTSIFSDVRLLSDIQVRALVISATLVILIIQGWKFDALFCKYSRFSHRRIHSMRLIGSVPIRRRNIEHRLRYRDNIRAVSPEIWYASFCFKTVHPGHILPLGTSDATTFLPLSKMLSNTPSSYLLSLLCQCLLQVGTSTMFSLHLTQFHQLPLRLS